MTDPVALLRCYPVAVTVGRIAYEIPALPAGPWIKAVLADNVLPGLLPPFAAEVFAEQLTAGTVPDGELEEVTRLAVQVAAGRPWWEVQRLVATLGAQADALGGELLLRGFDFERQSLGAFCAATYALCVRNMDKKERMKFDSALKSPPAEELRTDEDALADAFMRAMQAQG